MIKKGDSVYVRSKGLISSMIAYVSSGGNKSPDIPSHEAKVLRVMGNTITLIEVVFKGRREYDFNDYLRSGAKVWVKRDTYINDDNVHNMLAHLQMVKIKGYDWKLITGFLLRFMFRKVFPKKWNFCWITKVLDSKVAFVCSEFCNSGRRAIGMDIKENETPYDNFRKIPSENIDY